MAAEKTSSKYQTPTVCTYYELVIYQSTMHTLLLLIRLVLEYSLGSMHTHYAYVVRTLVVAVILCIRLVVYTYVRGVRARNIHTLVLSHS